MQAGSEDSDDYSADGVASQETRANGRAASAELRSWPSETNPTNGNMTQAVYGNFTPCTSYGKSLVTTIPAVL
jgi:hypothetical protein